MDAKQAKALFDKYIRGECTPRERELLERFLDSFQDRPVWSETEFDETTQQKIWAGIEARTQRLDGSNGGARLRWFRGG